MMQRSLKNRLKMIVSLGEEKDRIIVLNSNRRCLVVGVSTLNKENIKKNVTYLKRALDSKKKKYH